MDELDDDDVCGATKYGLVCSKKFGHQGAHVGKKEWFDVTAPKFDMEAAVASIQAERVEQMKLALQLRREGYSFREIGVRCPTFAKNGYSRFDKPKPRSATSTSCLLQQAVMNLVPEELRYEIAEALKIDTYRFEKD